VTYNDYAEYATQRGGKLLRMEGENPIFYCPIHDYEWKACPNVIKRQRWCRKCSISKAKINHTLEDVRQYGEPLNLECLETEYKTIKTRMKFLCPMHGLIYKTLGSLKRGEGCRKCGHIITNKKNTKYTIEDFQKYAESRGGECLSKDYIPNNGVEFYCPIHNHTWTVNTANLRDENWCVCCGYHDCLVGRREERYYNDTITNLNYDVIRQYPVKRRGRLYYFIDFYIPDLNVAIEYDERGHKYQTDKDTNRQKFIENRLGCSFIRIKEWEPETLTEDYLRHVLRKT
jgi:very-short-patch-repair endonuclease